MSALVRLIEGRVEPNTIWLEFGVALGATLRQLAEIATVIYGFDSFEGLPEDWCDENGGQQEPKGRFACQPPTDLPANVILVSGLFQDTLPKWIRDWDVGNIGFVHIDCDLYSSTRFVLEQLSPYLDNVIIAFDEIGPFPAGDYHEGRAWREFLAKGEYEAKLIGNQHTAGAVFKLTRVK